MTSDGNLSRFGHISRRELAKRGAALGLSGPALAAAVMAGAGRPSRANAQGAQPAPRGGDKVSFTYLRPTWGPATYTKDGAYEKTLQELGNVDIEVQIIPVIDFDTKINTILAAGDIPDVIWGVGPHAGVWLEAQEEGAFQPINEFLDKYTAVKDAVPAEIWDVLTAEDGNIYFVPNLIWPIVPFFIFYRQDLFEQAGLSEPTTPDEFVSTLEQVKTAFPDKVPWSLGYEWHMKDFVTAWGFTEHGWEPAPDDPNTLQQWFEKEKEVDYRFWLQDLHKRGLLDPEYRITNEPNRSTDNLKAGKVVVANENWFAYADIVSNLRKVEPDAKVGVLSPLGPTAGTRSVFPVDRGFYISAGFEDADGFFSFLNWTLTDGSDLRRYGVEGKTYTIEGDTKVPIADVDREADYKGPQIEPLRFLDPFSEKLDWEALQLSYESAGVGDLFEYARGKYDAYHANQYFDYRNRYVISPTEAKDGSRLYEDYLRGIDEGVVINHDLTKDDWNAKIDEWKEAGGSKILQEVNELQTDKAKPDYGV